MSEAVEVGLGVAAQIGYTVGLIDDIVDRIEGCPEKVGLLFTERDADVLLTALKRWRVRIEFGEEPSQFLLGSTLRLPTKLEED